MQFDYFYKIKFENIEKNRSLYYIVYHIKFDLIDNFYKAYRYKIRIKNYTN